MERRIEGRRSYRFQNRTAFTLLELILALSLSVVILMAIGMAVNLHLTSLDSRRDDLEQSQLARSLLRILADDIRSVVLHYEQDVSSVEELIKSAAQAAAGGGGGSGQGSSGSQGEEQQGGAEQTSGEPGQSELDETESSENTEDLSGSVALTAMPGIYGNQYELQIDISRLPRIEQYQSIYDTSSPSALRDIPSDIKTVTYYVQSTASGLSALAPAGDDLSQLTDPSVHSGLVRRELDRAVTEWAMTNSGGLALSQGGDVLAPEVVGIEFQYFDGYEWRTEWDSQTEGALPVAIQITLAMQAMEEGAEPETNVLAAGTTDLQEQTGIRFYRLVVQLPVGMPADAAAAGDMEALGL